MESKYLNAHDAIGTPIGKVCAVSYNAYGMNFEVAFLDTPAANSFLTALANPAPVVAEDEDDDA